MKKISKGLLALREQVWYCSGLLDILSLKCHIWPWSNIPEPEHYKPYADYFGLIRASFGQLMEEMASAETLDEEVALAIIGDCQEILATMEVMTSFKEIEGDPRFADYRVTWDRLHCLLHKLKNEAAALILE